MEPLPCKSCKGTGLRIREAFTYEGKTYPENRSACFSCEGKGTFDAPDFRAIVPLIKGRKGLRSARPKQANTVIARRAYYVWRMARFHGGVDVTMPVCAGLDVHGDPFVELLEKFAELVAVHVFGTDLAAAHRWGRALGYLDRDMPGLPSTAYQGGPVVTSRKPLEELPELMG